MDTLSNILREVGAPKEVGFLSIDCEGEDTNVLRELDLEVFPTLDLCGGRRQQSAHLH